jgi:hypothetical protein
MHRGGVMNKKAIKPSVDLVIARFAIFGILAILFTILSVNGVTPWFLWVLMLIGVFSIFSAAIEADEDSNAIKSLSLAINNHFKKLERERDEYKGVAENLDEMYVRECKKSKGLQKQLERCGYTNNGGVLMKPPIGEKPEFKPDIESIARIEELQSRIGSARYTLEELRERLLDNSEAQDLCDLAYVILGGEKTLKGVQYRQFQVGDEITAQFNNFMDVQVNVTGIIREVKNGALLQ